MATRLLHIVEAAFLVFRTIIATKIDDIAKATGKICVFACFPAGTLINAEHGQIPIEQIKVGDKVWAFDESSGTIDLKEVLQTTQRECDHAVGLYTARETIETTVEHCVLHDRRLEGRSGFAGGR